MYAARKETSKCKLFESDYYCYKLASCMQVVFIGGKLAWNWGGPYEVVVVHAVSKGNSAQGSSQQ